MTTIAYKDGVLAADSRETLSTEHGGTRVYDKCVKIEKYKAAQLVIAQTGDSSAGQVCADWYAAKRQGKRKAKPEFTADDDFELLILDKKGLWFMDRFMVAVPFVGDYFAAGSGSQVAFGALYAGASAKKAVKAAAEHDPFTGGKIRAYKINQPR